MLCLHLQLQDKNHFLIFILINLSNTPVTYFKAAGSKYKNWAHTGIVEKLGRTTNVSNIISLDFNKTFAVLIEYWHIIDNQTRSVY